MGVKLECLYKTMLTEKYITSKKQLTFLPNLPLKDFTLTNVR